MENSINRERIFLQAISAALPLRSAPELAAVGDVFAIRVVFVDSILILLISIENILERVQCLNKGIIMEVHNYVVSKNILGIQTNSKYIGWSFGHPSQTVAIGEINKCRLVVRFLVDPLNSESVELSSLEKYHYWRGESGKDELFYQRNFFAGNKLRLLARGLTNGKTEVITNKYYLKYIKFRFNNLHSPGYHLTDIVCALLLRKNLCPVHCSGFSINGKTFLVIAPPDTGKTLTTMRAVFDANASFLSEDLGITDEPYHTKMIEIADKIFTMEPDSSHAHRILGLAYYRTHFKKTNEHFKKAIITDPNNPELLEWYSAMLAFLWGKPSAAAPLVERLLEIDPITPFNQGVLSLYHLARGRIDEAINSAQKYLQLEPESLMAKATYAEWLGYTQDYHQAIHLFDEMIEDEPDHIFAFIYEFMKYAFLGEKEKALQLVLEDNRIQVAWNDCQLSRTIAEGFALLNEREKALDWLENAIDRGFINYPFFDGIDPHLENIRSEERFKELMKRVKKEWENFEV